MNSKSLLVKVQVLRTALNAPVRNASVTTWNKDWKPATTPPKNAAEIAAAAKKYGLLPHDYKPDPELGDYPDVPLVSVNARDPYEQWDDRYWRRNWGEPVHKDFMMYIGERTDTTREEYSTLFKTSCFLGFCSFFLFLYYLDINYGPKPKVVYFSAAFGLILSAFVFIPQCFRGRRQRFSRIADLLTDRASLQGAASTKKKSRRQ